LKNGTGSKLISTIVIAVGGFALTTVLRLKRRLLEINNGSLDGVPIRFLSIDTAHKDSYLTSEHYEISHEDLKLIGPEWTRIVFDPGPSFSWDTFPALKKIAPPDVQRIIADSGATEKGAKQIRALGRIAYEWTYDDIKEKAQQLVRGVFTQDSIQQGVSMQRTHQVYIISSTAGGTGSSIAIPMGYLLRTLDKSGGIDFKMEVNCFLALPELFSANRPRLYANTYQFFKELNYYMREDTVFEPSCGYEEPITEKPFDNVFAFSRSNGSVELRSKEELAEMLSSYIALETTA